jgi:transcriptional regulator with XRE-family HTH domain
MPQTRLKQLREEAVLTVHELAEASGVSDDTISKIENGQRIARPSTLRKLAQALVVSPQELRKPAAVEEVALAGKAEAGAEPSVYPKARSPLSAGRALAIANFDDLRRVVKDAPTAELEQTALELAKLTKVPTREDLVGDKDNKEAHLRTMANFCIGVINVVLDSRGVRSPVEHVATRLDDALTPPEEPREEERAG